MDGLTELGQWLARWPVLIEGGLSYFGLAMAGQNLGWSIVQLAAVVLAFSLSLVLAHLALPGLEAFVARARLRPPYLRLIAVVLKRLQGLIFALLLWFAVATLRATTWGSHSYFLSLAASLVSSWIAITIASRVIRNRSLARLVEIGGWVLVTLGLLGILPEATALMDELAVRVGEWRISLLLVVQGIVVIWVLLWVAGLASRVLEKQLLGLDDISPTQRVLIGTVVRTGLVILALVVGLDTVGVDFSALSFVSGAVGVGLGFGLQKIVSNFVSGIILLTDRSIKPGDLISVGDSFGLISSLNARYVSVSMFDGREVLIPNEDLITEPVENWSFADSYIRIEIRFGVSYDSDPHRVRAVALEAALGQPRVVGDHPRYTALCHISEFGDSSINFVLGFFIADPSNGIANVRGEVLLRLWDAFRREGIVFPYPQREVTVKSTAPSGSAPGGT